MHARFSSARTRKPRESRASAYGRSRGDAEHQRHDRGLTAWRDRDLYVADLVPPDGGCTGTLTFLPSGPHFDLFIPLNGKPMWMIQTDPGNVFQGTVTQVSN